MLRYAGVLKPRHICIVAGAATGPAARASLTANLRWAAARAPKQSLTVAPTARSEGVGDYLDDFDLAAMILADVGAANLGLQCDVWQAQAIAGDALAVWRRHSALIRHIRIAGLADHHEPTGGFFDFPAFFRAVDASGYTGGYTGGYAGWITAAYDPATDTAAGLGWLGQAQV